MRTTRLSVLLAIDIMVACGHAGYVQPPVGSFEIGRAQLRAADTLVPLRAAFVSVDFFRSTRAQPLLGRFFVDGDENTSPTRLVVLSHDLWSRRFNSVPAAVGQTLELDGRAATIVGVATGDFDLPDRTEIWILRSANTQK
jgi:hypothetical protein